MRSNKPWRAEQVALPWDVPGLVAGVDEAGRGPLAGPVVAAAVILDDLKPIPGLADSKTLSARQRERLSEAIHARALCFSVAQASVEEIVLVDGNRLPTLDIMAEAVVQGDRKVPAISAASILAKVARDRWCLEIDAEYPLYGFAAHKGYGTAQHLAALQRHGATPWHRRSFSPVAKVLLRGTP
jgi:ribonuclease HII